MITPGRFTSRPITIEAVEVTSDNRLEVIEWINGYLSQAEPGDSETLLALDQGYGIIIPTLEGDMVAMPGWWVIRGIKGEFYPCRGDVFTEKYEATPE